MIIIIHNVINRCIPLKYTLEEIKKSQNCYKDNKNYNVFVEKMKKNPLTSKIIEDPKYLFVFQKQANKKSGLQPSKLLEINIGDSLAEYMGLNNYKICERDEIPKEIKPYLLKNAKLVYYNDNFSILLVLYGDPNSTDAQYINHNTKQNIEIKDIVARVLEADLLYDMDGKLYFSAKNLEKYSCYQPIIDIFNENNNIFDQLGSNYPIKEEYTEILKTALKQYIENKKIDYFCFVVKKDEKEQIMLVPSDGLENKVSFTGSEIRPTGKNVIRVWLPTLYEDRLALVSGIRITENGKRYIKISVDEEQIIPIIGRTKSTVTSMKICDFFKFHLKDVLIKDGYYYVPEKLIKQIEANICVHIQLLPEYIP